MGIPKSFPDGNLDDRDWIGDIWEWLQGQPQTAWLYFARTANWDDMDWLFPQMVMHPDCDRALASWLFWSIGPEDRIADPVETHRPDDLLSAILDRAANGGWPSRGLHYRRVEVALHALRTAERLAKSERGAAFAIPRQLCASFEGSNAALEMDDETRADWRELADAHHVTITESDDENIRFHRSGGNWWFEPALILPDNPVTTPTMSDIEAIEAVFGDHRDALARVELARLSSLGRTRRLTDSDWKRIRNAPQSDWPVPKKRGALRWLAKFVVFNAIGVAALIGSLHFLGPIAAAVALLAWISASWYLFL